MSSLASVAVGRPVRGEFTYLVPEALAGKLTAGQRVLVPFGRAKALGFYLGPAPSPPAAGTARLRPIERALEEVPALPADVLAVLRFAAEHYRYPVGEAIRAALPPGLSSAQPVARAGPPTQAFAVTLPGADPSALRRAPAQAAVLSYLLAVGGRASVDEVVHAVPGARPSLRKLAERGLLELVNEALTPQVRTGLGQERPAALTSEQGAALEELCAALEQGTFRPFLLEGVTGSGKTEVYLRLIERAVELGRGALVLVPEIALTPQLVGRFRSRFGPNVAVLHSALTDKERLHAWQTLHGGECQIAVGVRSAVFAPVPRLAVLVVDEEHEPSFKQEEKLRYHARDLAVVRAKQAGAVVVLGSATPSLESLENARRGRYGHLRLRSRVDDRPMPEVELVDLRLHRPRFDLSQGEPPILSEPLRVAVKEVLDRGQQAILFLNRRGHSTFLLCPTCGASVRCDECDVSLTLHRAQQRLLCHYCGASRPTVQRCDRCEVPLLELGAGTEKVEAEVATHFPGARVARLDRDAAGSAEKLTELLAAFARRELDVLVGTQMVAKGHDFPGVTLVCVVLADTALTLPDFRASERTFQLLTQVAGRAGRGKDPGRVLVQTYNPECEPIQRMLARDFEGFCSTELAWRRALSYPPYARLAAVRLDGADPAQVASVARTLGRQLVALLPPPKVGVRLLGPAPAPLARLKGKSRWQLLLKAPSHAALAPLLQRVEVFTAEAPAGVRVALDVDPMTML